MYFILCLPGPLKIAASTKLDVEMYETFSVGAKSKVVSYVQLFFFFRICFNAVGLLHPTRHQLYGHLPPITKTIQVSQTRHAGHCWRSRDELKSDVLFWTPTHGRAKAGRPARTYIQQLCEDVVQKTCLRRWTIGRSGERGSGISVLPARHDDDDDDEIGIVDIIFLWAKTVEK